MSKTDAFKATFAALHKILKPYARQLAVVVDKPGKYYLKSTTAKTAAGAVSWFAGAGHAISAERADEWAAVIAAFLTREP